MKCPIDGNELVAVERTGIEIDYCPNCRGVWLDRGELDKLVQREGERTAAYDREYEEYEKRKRVEYDDDRYERRESYPPAPPQQQGYDPRYGSKPHKRKSVFEEVFDIFD